MTILKNRTPGVTALTCLLLLLGSCSRDPEKAKAKYLASGQNYMKDGKYGDAAIEFRNALRLDPRFVDAYYDLAQADLAQNDWNAAYASLEKAINLDPTRLDARLDLGRLYLAARQFDRAEDEARFVLKEEKNSVGAYQLLGAALIGEQRTDQALMAFAKVTELRPNDPSAYVNQALVEISLREFPAAEQHLKRAIEVDPTSIQAFADLANFYRLQNRFPEAILILQNGISKNPTGASLYIDMASLLESQGKSEESVAVLDGLRRSAPDSVDAATAIGDFYFQRREADKALAEYRRALSAAPQNLEVKKRIQDLYLSTNQLQLAADLDRALMKEAPKDVIVRVDHGRLIMLQGNPHEASLYLQRVVADAADSVPAHYYLAMAYRQNGDLTRAQTGLMDALKIAPNSSVAMQELARLSLERGNVADAKIYSQDLIRSFPADPANRLLLAEALGRLAQLREAEEQALIARQLAPRDPLVHLELAQIYVAQKKHLEAQKEFETALQFDPHNSAALAQYADFLTSRNQALVAITRVQQFVSANPQDANGHVVLGALNFESKSYTASQNEFEKAIELDHNNIQAYLRLGKVYEAQGNGDAAIARYQRALALKPNLAPLSTMLGNLYLNKGDLVTARKYFTQAVDADPNFAAAIANIAWLDAEEGKNLDVALGMAEKAKSLSPNSDSITDTLAWVLYKRADYSGASRLLQELVRKSPDSAEFRYHLGMSLMAMGQTSDAKRQLETALRMKLDTAEDQQARQALSLAR